MGGEADAYASRAHGLELGQVVGRGFLPEALEPTAPVGRQQEDDLDAGFRRRLHGRVRLRQPQVVELADGPVPGCEHLRVDLDIARTDLFRGQTPGQVQHGLAPGPEVLALDMPA